MRRWQALGAVAGLVAVALVPLYGDPRQAPVTHAEWARLLVRGLELEDMLETTATASQVFAALSWKTSLSFPAPDHVRATGAFTQGERVVTREEPGEVAYPLGIVRGGDYRVRLRVQGDPAQAVTVEVARLGEIGSESVFTVIPAAVPSWIDAGAAHLDPGSYQISVLLPPNAELAFVEVQPPCLSPVEPKGGWQATAITTADDVAVTVLQALGREELLPPADLPVEVDGARFHDVAAEVTPVALETGGVEGTWLRAARGGTEAVALVELDEPGLYTVSAFGEGGSGQRWFANSCNKTVVCPDTAAVGGGPEWRTLLTSRFARGKHFVSVTLAEGSAVGRLRFERKLEEGPDYVGALARLGCDAGEPGQPITRAQAADMMRCLREKHSQAVSACGDIVPPTAGILAATSSTGPGGPGGPGGQPPIVTPIQPPLNPGGGVPPLQPPLIPPQPPASPILP